MAAVASHQTAEYPTAKRLLRLPIEGQKRRKLLVILGMLADEGRLVDGKEPVALDELAERASLPPQRVGALLRRMDDDDLISVRWTRKRNHVHVELLT